MDKKESELRKEIENIDSHFSFLLNLIPIQYFSAPTGKSKNYSVLNKLKDREISKCEVSPKNTCKYRELSGDAAVPSETKANKNKSPSVKNISKNGGMMKPPVVGIISERATSIEELRNRLHDKIQKLRGQRPVLEKNDLRKKNKDKKENQNLKSESNNVLNQKQSKESSLEIIVKTEIEDNIEQKVAKKDKVNKNKKLVFSKFEFDDKKSKQVQGKDYKSLLERAVIKETKLKKLKEKDEQKGEMMENKNKWITAIQKAEGMKLKDNPELLRKSLKSKEKKKKRSAKKWENRVSFVEKQKQEKQKKRKDNIEMAKNKRKAYRLKRLAKKGRILPGELD